MSLIILNVDEVRRTLSASGGAFVTHDKEVDVVRFAINTGFTDVVLDEHSALRVMYQRPGESQVRAQTLTYYDTDGLRNYYDWQLLTADLEHKGTIACALCILRMDSTVEEWHTTPCQIRVLDTIHTDDSDEADETITPTVAERVTVLETMIQRVASGAPIVVASTSAMTDTEQIYVLSTNGNWYYHNGSAWVSGGEYGAIATDTTLTQSGIPADAKAVGDAINAVTSDVEEVQDALEHLDVETDPTLSIDGKPADAKATGDRIRTLETASSRNSSDISGIKDDIKDLAGGIPDAQKRLIIAIMRSSLYSSDQSENIGTLEDLFFANIPATSISLDKSSMSLLADEQEEQTAVLIATVHPVYTTDAVVWSSSNDTVATVSDNGLVTAIAPGTAIITAKAGDVSAQCNVVVSADELTSINAVYRQTKTIYTFTPLDSLKDDLTVTAIYESGKRTVLADYDYTLSGRLSAGTSVITVTYGGFSTTFNATVSDLTLDTIAYENKSYRDIFMTGNMFVDTDFENGLPAGWTVNSGNPEITTEDYLTTGRSLKAFGTTSAQYIVASDTLGKQAENVSGKTYYNAFVGKCIRYVKGNLGVSVYNAATGQNFATVNGITDGWAVLSKIETAESNYSPYRFFIGSYTSADLDAYIDNIVRINLTDMFTTVPSKETMDELYEMYCNIRSGGAS